MNPFEPLFTIKDISIPLTGLNENLMQNWFVRKVITIQDKSPGRGKKRLYSFHEALQICFVHEMVKEKETTTVAGPVALCCADFICKDLPKKGYGLDEPQHGYEYILLYNVNPLTYRFILKKDFDIFENDRRYFRFFDFHRIAWLYCDDIDYGSGINFTKWGADERGMPLNPDHPWNKDKS